MSNVIPEDWKVLTIESVLDNIIDYRGKSPPKSEVGIPLITAKNVRKGYIDEEPREFIYENQFDTWMVRGTPRYGDVFITTEAPLGNVAKVPKYKFAIGQRLLALSPSADILSSDFLLQILQGEKFTEQLDLQSTGSTVAGIKQSTFRKMPLPIPPLPEQQKIAAILSSVDEVIEKTQAQIRKLKDLKTGMMQELLSPREGQAANINNPQGESKNSLHHIEFKDSPLGRIPVGWDCQLLDKVAKRGSGHTPDKKKPEYWNDGVKWVSLTDSSKLDQLYISNTAKNVSALGIENSSAVLHPAGTVVMTRDAGIGKSAITTDVMAVSQHLIAWMCGEKLDNYFLYYILQLWKPQFEAIAMGSTIKTIGLPYFKQLKVPVPPIDEQKNIANSLKSVDHKVFSLEKKNSQNIAIKKALMQDLLTGKKRVKLR